MKTKYIVFGIIVALFISDVFGFSSNAGFDDDFAPSDLDRLIGDDNDHYDHPLEADVAEIKEQDYDDDESFDCLNTCDSNYGEGTAEMYHPDVKDIAENIFEEKDSENEKNRVHEHVRQRFLHECRAGCGVVEDSPDTLSAPLPCRSECFRLHFFEPKKPKYGVSSIRKENVNDVDTADSDETYILPGEERVIRKELATCLTNCASGIYPTGSPEASPSGTPTPTAVPQTTETPTPVPETETTPTPTAEATAETSATPTAVPSPTPVTAVSNDEEDTEPDVPLEEPHEPEEIDMHKDEFHEPEEIDMHKDEFHEPEEIDMHKDELEPHEPEEIDLHKEEPHEPEEHKEEPHEPEEIDLHKEEPHEPEEIDMHKDEFHEPEEIDMHKDELEPHEPEEIDLHKEEPEKTDVPKVEAHEPGEIALPKEDALEPEEIVVPKEEAHEPEKTNEPPKIEPSRTSEKKDSVVDAAKDVEQFLDQYGA